MHSSRYDRSIQFFGRVGQDKLADARVAVVGIGGLGTHVVQQLCLLGVARLALIDDQTINDNNRNRYIGLKSDDTAQETLKVAIGRRLVDEVNPAVETLVVRRPLASREAFDTILDSSYIFGCLDNDLSRVVLNELSTASSKPYIDLSSDIVGSQYGGRICVLWDGAGCLSCYGELDSRAIQIAGMSAAARADQKSIYGVPVEDLRGGSGPSVVSINGVVASVGVTEFMLLVTGMRSDPRRLLKYHADRGIVNVVADSPVADCYYCSGIRGQGDASGVWRFVDEE